MDVRNNDDDEGIRVNGVASGPTWTPLQVSGAATQEKTGKLWRPDTLWQARPARRACINLCSIGS